VDEPAGWGGRAARGRGSVGTAIIGVFTLAYALSATVAAREEWLGRPLGRLIGLVVALVALFATIVCLLVVDLHEIEPAFYIAGAVGVLTAIALLVPDRTRGGNDDIGYTT
jgi:energy-converting hydrogenase Eha subunit B